MIRATNLTKTYFQGRQRIEAVKHANFEVSRGESVLIAGPSGAGKSTLLHLLGGLDKPTEGIILFDGVDFYSLSDRERSKIRNEKVGFVFQFYHLLPEFTVLENTMLPALMKRKKNFKNKKDIERRANQLLGIVGLAGRTLHRPSELSGGESQRVAIARSLINYPEVLLCDEPTGNLDSKKGEEVIECLWMLKEKEKMALVLVTHDERIKKDFDKKYRIKDGAIEELHYESQSLPEWKIRK